MIYPAMLFASVMFFHPVAAVGSGSALEGFAPEAPRLHATVSHLIVGSPANDVNQRPHTWHGPIHPPVRNPHQKQPSQHKKGRSQ